MLSKDDLKGSWHLESWTIGYSGQDDFICPYGEDPKGVLLYTDDGWMSVSIGRRERAAFPEGVEYCNISEADRAEAFKSYFHYAGRYRVVDGDVIHYVTHGLDPNSPGSQVLRHAELDGQTLVLSGKDHLGDVTRFHSLVWHKLAPIEDHEVIDSE